MSEKIGDCGLETIQTLLDLLNPLHGDLDNQLYDERRKQSGSEMDIPRDAEFSVNITEGQERDLVQAVLILEDRKRHAQSASPLPLRAREEIARELRFYGGNGETESQACMLRTADYLTFHPEDDVRWAVNVLLEKIAAKFEANDTWDIWKSDAASLVRSFKHDLSSTAGQEWRDISSAKKVHAHEIAMTLCEVDGHDPDTEAPLTEMCDDANMPVPWWMVYVEYAEALLDKFTILPAPPVAEPIVADKRTEEK